MKRFVSSPENLLIIDALAAALRELPEEQILTRARIANLTKDKPHLLYRALKLVERDDGCVFATVIGVGVKKLKPSDAHVIGVRTREQVARRVGKTKKKIVGVLRTNENKLNAQERSVISTEINKLGLIVEFC
jgi:hypothetical protein